MPKRRLDGRIIVHLSFAALVAAVPLAQARSEGSPPVPASATSETPKRHSLIQRPNKNKTAKATASSGPRATPSDQTPASPDQPIEAVSPAPKVPPPVPLAPEPGPAETPPAPTPQGQPAAGSPPIRRSAAASVTQPAVPLSAVEPGASKSVLANQSPASDAGTSRGGAITSSRGFNNLLSKFPQLGSTLRHIPGSSPPPPTPPSPNTQSPGAPSPTTPVPVVTAPAPAAPTPTGIVMGSAVLHWHQNREQDLAGYKIYVGTRSGLYDYPGSPFVVGNTTTTTISNLPRGQTYFFAATAYDHTGNESAPSAEVSKSLY